MKNSIYETKSAIKRFSKINTSLFLLTAIIYSSLFLPIKRVDAAQVISVIAVSPGGSLYPPIQVGSTLQFVANAIDQNLAPMVPQPSFAWMSNNPSVGTIDVNGLFSAVGPGTATITATSGGLSGTTTITVTNLAPVITTIVVWPSPLSLDVNTTQQMTAIAYDQFMVPLAIQPVFTWSSNNPTIGNVNATGLFSAAATPGNITITASAGNLIGSTVISVTQPLQRIMADIFLTPSNFTPSQIPAGGTLQFTAKAIDQTLAPMSPQPTFTWTSSNPAVVSISSTGLASGLAVGTSVITASASNGLTTIVSRSSSITVTPAVCQTAADTNGDGKISMAELLGYIGRWKSGSVTMQLVLRAVGFWKVGVGC